MQRLSWLSFQNRKADSSRYYWIEYDYEEAPWPPAGTRQFIYGVKLCGWWSIGRECVRTGIYAGCWCCAFFRMPASDVMFDFFGRELGKGDGDAMAGVGLISSYLKCDGRCWKGMS